VPLDLRPELVLKRVPLSHGTMLARRAWLRRIPYASHLRRSQDRDFWIRAITFEKSDVALLDQPRYFYRIPESITLAKTLEGFGTRMQYSVFRCYLSPRAMQELRWELAKLIEMRDVVLVQAQNQLDAMAAGLSSALSDKVTAGTEVTVGAQSGFEVDVGALLSGNTINLTYDGVTNLDTGSNTGPFLAPGLDSIAEHRPELRRRLPEQAVERGEADRLGVPLDLDRVLAVLSGVGHRLTGTG
jgi:CRISPR-associated endonuclease Cas2